QRAAGLLSARRIVEPSWWKPHSVGFETVKSSKGFPAARCAASAALKRFGARFQLVRFANMNRAEARRNAPDCLFAQVEKRQQKNPESIHEMPIVRSDFRGCWKRDFCPFKFPDGNKEQGADASQKMDCVRASENVKK